MAKGNDKELKLGVLFKGNIDKTLQASVTKLNTLLKGLDGTLNNLSKATKSSKSGLNDLGSEMTAYQLAAGKSITRTKAYQKAFGELGATYGKSAAAMRRWVPLLNKADDAIAKQSMSFEQAGIGGKKYYDTTSRLGVMQQKLAGKIKYTSDGISHLSKATEKAIGPTKNLSTESDKVKSSLSSLTSQAKTSSGAIDRLTNALKTTAAYGSAASAIYAVTNALQGGAQAIIDYDQGLKNLQAITSSTDFEVAAMGETIKQVARDTKFSTSEAADGMTLLGQAGLTAGESMTAMRDTALLATGTLSEMQTSTDLVSTTIRAFNLSATESGRIVDVMANAVNKSKLTIDKLRTAFNYVAATSAQAGLSIEETAATMMTLANNGLRASTIGTGFRQVLSKMLKPSAKLAEALAGVGLTLDSVNPSMVGWEGTLKSLSTVLYDTDTKTVNMAKAFGLFGLRGAQAAAVVIKSFVSGDYQNALNKVYEIGTAEEMAGKQAEGLAVKLKNLVDRAGNVAVAFGDAGAANGIRVF